MQHYKLSNFAMQRSSGLGVGRLLTAHTAGTDNKVSHVFKTLGTELQMCPIMS